MSCTHDLKSSLLKNLLIPCSISHWLPSELERKTTFFKLDFPQSKLVSMSFEEVLLIWNCVLCFSCCFPQLRESDFHLPFSKSYPFCFFEKLVPTLGHNNFSFLFFIALIYICQNKRHRLSKVNYLLPVYILGLQVDFKSLEAMDSGLHLFSYY